MVRPRGSLPSFWMSFLTSRPSSELVVLYLNTRSGVVNFPEWNTSIFGSAFLIVSATQQSNGSSWTVPTKADVRREIGISPWVILGDPRRECVVNLFDNLDVVHLSQSLFISTTNKERNTPRVDYVRLTVSTLPAPAAKFALGLPPRDRLRRPVRSARRASAILLGMRSRRVPLLCLPSAVGAGG